MQYYHISNKRATRETLTKVRTKYSFWGNMLQFFYYVIGHPLPKKKKKKKDKHHKNFFDFWRQYVPHLGVLLGPFYLLHGNLHFLFGAWTNRLCWNLTSTCDSLLAFGPHVLSVLFDWCCWLEPLAKVGHFLPEACLGVCTQCFPHRETRQRNAFYSGSCWPATGLTETEHLTHEDLVTQRILHFLRYASSGLKIRFERSSNLLLSGENSRIYMTCPTDILILQDGVATIPSQGTWCSIPLPETKVLALCGPWLTDFPKFLALLHCLFG